MSARDTIILGISAFYHDSAAVLIVNGEIIAAAHEERFTRKKHDDAFPVHAVRYVMAEYGATLETISAIVFYDKPYIKLERLLETYLSFAPRGVRSFITAMPVWFHKKIFARREIWSGMKEACKTLPKRLPQLLFSEHHLSHAASAFYPSPFNEAAILTVDGVGEWTTASISRGSGKSIEVLREMHFPHSVGLLYSAFTYYCGFQVNSGEYKLMGLAPYGHYQSAQVALFKKLITTILITIFPDGSIKLNMDYFNFATGLTMVHEAKWEKLFGIPRRMSEQEITEVYMNLALAIQEVTEEIVIKLATTAKTLTGSKRLVMAGGVALNCVANSKIVDAKIFDDVWVQPASGDAGGALGAAYVGYYLEEDTSRDVKTEKDAMKGCALGPEYQDKDAISVAHAMNAPFTLFTNETERSTTVARLIATGNVIGWFQGRMEWGPRALGNRSILGDARNPDMQKKINLMVKFREGFRPFAPSVLIEDVYEYFDWKSPSPYMLFVAPVQEVRRKKSVSSGTLYERLYRERSDIPAVTHMDYSARLQTVSRENNEAYWNLLSAFKKETGHGLLINTSFNVRGEPIVCTPFDAYRCFIASDIDYLVIGNVLFDKKSQPTREEVLFKKGMYALD